MRRRDFIEFIGLGMASLAASQCSRRSQNIILEQKPNILFIMTDDHASQAISCYGSKINKTPHIDRIASQGIRFNNCFCTNSICAPSRATILTGKYSHINGVRNNAQEFDVTQMTFPKLLKDAGFQTAMIGKWHLKSAPTGFDYWNVLPGQGHYYNPDFIEMGQKKHHTGYVTDIITDRALDYLQNKRNKDQPFLMMLHHKAPHRNWQPALRHLTKYDQTKIPEPDTLFDDYSSRSDAAKEQEMTIREHMHLQYDLKMGPPPDRMTEEQKIAWENAYGPKREAFNKKNPKGKDLVRWKYQRYMQDYLGCIAGVDENVLASLAKNEPVHKWRDAIYYHYYEYPSVHMVKRHYGIRTKRYKLIHFYYDIDQWEMYDLKKDPKELNNIYHDPAYSEIAAELKSKLDSLQNKYEDSEALAQDFLKKDLKKK
ncbi:MAG TPA: sulfatase-like hydrolase/transferase [Acidobacteriota bacterium]|nr:sulfatase-like hydrolase/transferase [Acidobacteriota bacterium]